MTEIPEHLLKRAKAAREAAAEGEGEDQDDPRPSIPAHLLERSRATSVGRAALGGTTAEEIRDLREATAPLEREIHTGSGDSTADDMRRLRDLTGNLGLGTPNSLFGGLGLSDEPDEFNIFFRISITGHRAPVFGSNETARTDVDGSVKADLDEGKITIIMDIDVYADDSADQVRELTLRLPQNLQQLQIQQNDEEPS